MQAIGLREFPKVLLGVLRLCTTDFTQQYLALQQFVPRGFQLGTAKALAWW